MKTINILIITCLVIPQLSFSRPIKPLCELIQENFNYQMKDAKTKEEKKEIIEKFKKIIKNRNCNFIKKDI